MKEEWRELLGYEGLYKVSSLGSIAACDKIVGVRKAFRPEKLLSQARTRDGYKTISIVKNGKKKSYLSHRVVAIAFIPNPENKPQVNHINGIKDDNRVENLEWATQSENMLHRTHELGIRNYGEKCPKTKLSNADALEIRRLHKQGEKSAILVKKFNVNRNIIWQITSNRTFKEEHF